MSSYDLIWRLIELLLKDKETKSKADDQKKDKYSLGRIFGNRDGSLFWKREPSLFSKFSPLTAKH